MVGQWKKGGYPTVWDGKAAEWIVGRLERLLLLAGVQIKKNRLR
jgi:hypothetical protein